MVDNGDPGAAPCPLEGGSRGSPVTVKQIAEAIGVSRSQVSRYLLKYGIAPVGKMPSMRGKRASVYPADTVARLRALGVG